MHLCRYLVLHRLEHGGWLAINGLSGAVDLLDDSTREKLEAVATGAGLRCDPELVARLRQRSYLFDGPEDEERLLLAMWERHRKRARERPLRFALCPTHGCNLACRYCFEGEITSKPSPALGDDAVAAAFHAMERIGAGDPGRKLEVSLFGGEPLLPSTGRAVRRILQEAESRGMSVVVVTNGTELASAYGDLLERFRRVFNHFQVTIDGPPHIHDMRRPFRSGRGSYQAIVDGVDLLLRLGLNVALRVNLDGHNVRHLPELAEIIVRRGWAGRNNLRCVLAPVADHLGSSGYPDLLPEDALVRELADVIAASEAVRRLFSMDLFRSAQHIGSVLGLTGVKAQPMFRYCEANGLNAFTLGADGYIYPCSEMLGQPELATGTFFPSFEIDETRAAPWRERSIISMAGCRSCHVATFCGGGCAYQSLKRCGSPMEPSCYGAEKVISAFLERFGDRIVPRAT